MISEEEVKHIARLSNIGLNAQELKDLQGELSSILDYFNKLQEIKTGSLKEQSSPANLNNVTRKDKAVTVEGDHKKILSLVPKEKDNFVKVKTIL